MPRRKLPPNLRARKFTTADGRTRTLYYVRLRWQDTDYEIPAGDSLSVAIQKRDKDHSATTGWFRRRLANLRQAKTSSSSRSGRSSRTCTGVKPLAKRSKTSVTRIRMPRTQGRPPHCSGSTVIPSARLTIVTFWFHLDNAQLGIKIDFLGKSGHRAERAIFPKRSKYSILPSWLHSQNSFAPASKYKAFFSSISSSVLLKDSISTQSSGATEHSASSFILWYVSLDAQATSATFVPFDVRTAQSVSICPSVLCNRRRAAISPLEHGLGHREGRHDNPPLGVKLDFIGEILQFRTATRLGGDQGRLYGDVSSAFVAAMEEDFVGWEHDTYVSEEKGHGRVERRTYYTLPVRSGSGMRCYGRI